MKHQRESISQESSEHQPRLIAERIGGWTPFCLRDDIEALGIRPSRAANKLGIVLNPIRASHKLSESDIRRRVAATGLHCTAASCLRRRVGSDGRHLERWR